MLASYNTIMGIASIVWPKISGVGDITPPIKKDSTITYFLLLVSERDDINPICASTTMNKGNSKTTPKGKTIPRTNETYCPNENIGSSASLEYPRKNWTAGGKTKKYAKARPV